MEVQIRERLDAIGKAFSEQAYKCVISNPVSGAEYRKIEMNRMDGQWFLEKYTQKQVFHEKKSHEDARTFLTEMFGESFKNVNVWTDEYEYTLRLSKKGKLMTGRQCMEKQQAPKVRVGHNREKNYILPQGTRIEPLIDMGVFTKDGKVVNSMYDKYRQINRFIEIVDDEVKNLPDKKLTIIDFGCGKSYLTFILYYYFTEIKKAEVEMIGLDLKEDVIEKCNQTAKKYGYGGLRFEVGDIGKYKNSGEIDVVISLHACDTATDFALFNAISWNARMIFSVPCCQHELNNQIRSEQFSLLTRYGIVKERISALLTDSIRCNLLEVCGYRTQMVEFVAFEHTPKNIMIRAVKRPGKGAPEKMAEVERVLSEFHLEPTLYKLLDQAGYLQR
ncbi:MAG: SAM-dependent methyltransferase [Lachnospiraceae bacterium]|nr:SAM-dependent methyltransferase [Lachnospiraceae bacterium]